MSDELPDLDDPSFNKSGAQAALGFSGIPCAVGGGRIGRSGILRMLPRLVHKGTVIVLDDTHRRAERRLAEEIANRCGMSVEARTKRVFGLSRGFSILSPVARLTVQFQTKAHKSFAPSVRLPTDVST